MPPRCVYITSYKELNGKRQARVREKRSRVDLGVERGKIEGEDREQLGDGQKTRKLNSASNDSCLLCVGVEYMEIDMIQPCFCRIHVLDTGWNREGGRDRGRIRAKGQG